MKIVGEGISKYYRNGKVATKGIDGVDIALEEGDFALLIGSSGSGKSTLAKVLSMQLSFDEGDIYFDGKKEFSLKEKERESLKAFDIAYISPNDSFIESLSPLDNLLIQAMGAYPSKKEAKKAAKEALASLGLEKVMHRKVSLLSGGERDRTAIALALILPASVFFFDEPLADLNGSFKELCLNKIIEKTKGKTVLFITHDPELLKPYASCLYKMEGGKIISKMNIGGGEKEAPRSETSGKVHGFSPFYLFKGKWFRILSSLGICLLLGIFLTALGHWGFSIYQANLVEERYRYSFSNHSPNRLVVVGEDAPPSNGKEDIGDLFGDISLIATYLDEEGKTYALPSSSLQPVMPSGLPTMGEKGKEGCYLLMKRSVYDEQSLSFSYIEKAIGKTITIYDSGNYRAKSHPFLAEATFEGFYVLDDSSFYLGSDFSLSASEGVLSEIRNSLIERLEEEVNSLEEVDAPLYREGGSSNGGMSMRGGEKILSSLSDGEFYSYPASYLSSSGEELPPGKIYLPSDMEGKEFSFSYKGRVITMADIGDYLFYMGWPMKNGEWHAPSQVLRKISLEFNLERSIYFSSSEEMADYESRASDVLCRRGDSRILVSASSLDTMNTLWLVFMALAGLSFSLLSSWLLRKMYKGKEEDARVLLGRGYSSGYLAFGESFSYGLLVLVSVAICFSAYFLFIGDLLVSFPLLMIFIFAGLFAIIASMIPLEKKKFRRI